MKPSEISEIAEKIASLPSSNIKAIADAFEYSGDKNSLKEHDDIDIADILISWYKRNKNIQEPRRVFARKISKLGEQEKLNKQEEGNEQEVKAAFIKMAKDVDIYFDSKALS